MDAWIYQLVHYGLARGLLEPEDEIYTVNRLLEILQRDSYEPPVPPPEPADLETILAYLLEDAAARDLCGDSVTERDLFDTKLMAALLPRPSQVIARFRAEYERSPKAATDWYYRFCCDSDYIRRYRVKKDLKWTTATEYGDLDITINLSKPEKDPKDIAAAKLAPQSGYPKCQLCKENEGYAGRLNAPPRGNHRVIPLTVNGAPWMLQYSPYVYYNEHCIVFNQEHTPMTICRATFQKLLSFVSQFPHYFVGSNADLPIVGGSILSHDHFQGGRYVFAMERAAIERPVSFLDFADVTAGVVRWPMSVIRLSCPDPDRLVSLADRILTAWRGWSDPTAEIFAETDGVPHNTITPIARMRAGQYELDLVLRNNRTTPEHPLGLFHPHAGLHHIKKENIGLIEVMGLAVLPARLRDEMTALKKLLLRGGNPAADPVLAKHAQWVAEFLPKYDAVTPDNAQEILQREIGLVFAKVLEDAGVYKRTAAGQAAFDRFLAAVR